MLVSGECGRLSYHARNRHAPFYKAAEETKFVQQTSFRRGDAIAGKEAIIVTATTDKLDATRWTGDPDILAAKVLAFVILFGAIGFAIMGAMIF